MRNIKKTMVLKEYKWLLYNRETKEELETTFQVSEVEKTMPKPPANCTILEETLLAEKTATYTMSPQTYVMNATIVE